MPVLLNFELKLPNGANSPFLIVAGGADLDGDGTVEDNGEFQAFTRAGAAYTWTLQQQLGGNAVGTWFYVQFTVGPNVAYEFTLKDGPGAVLFHSQNITGSATEFVRWRL